MFRDLSLSGFGTSLYNAVKTGFDATPLLIYAYMAFVVLALAVMLYMDWYRHFKLKGKCLTNGLDKMKPALRWLCYYGLIAFIMAGFIMNNGGFGASATTNTQLIVYGNLEVLII